MHGRKRSEYKSLQRDPKVAAGLAAKAEKWHALNAKLASSRATPTATETTFQSDDTHVQNTLALSEKLLIVNPDPLYLWNHRREILIQQKARAFSIEQELTLTATALQNNPKAYGAWFHRKWSLTRTVTEVGSDEALLLSAELALTENVLQRDERNFHCWNYRRFVVSLLLQGVDGTWRLDSALKSGTVLMGAQIATEKTNMSHVTPLTKDEQNEILEAEWDFTNNKIRENFSNFSAFHYRSKLWHWKLSGTVDKQALMREEMALVENGIFTEPDDQTCWWYHRFLLQQLDSEHDSPWSTAMIADHLVLLEELGAEVESASKWVCLGTWHVLQVMEDTGAEIAQYRQTKLEELMELDPDRRQRYQYLLRQLSGC
jgi:geranylgeranyl transferase type-2 subunit alpha